MKHFDVQGVELSAPAARVFAYVADPAHLPDWTALFRAQPPVTANFDYPAALRRLLRAHP